MKFLFIITAVISFLLAKETPGECPTFSGVKNFNADAYVGRWYEFRRDDGLIFEWFGECSTATYSIKPTGKLKVENRAWFWWTFFSYYTVELEGNCNGAGETADCWVSYPPSKEEKIDRPNY